MKALFFSFSILILLTLSITQGHATNYYVSQKSGNDSRSLAEAQNPSTPWKSIDKINSLFNYLKPGDAILFNRGETFYGTLHISASGSSSSPIKVGAYGSGAKPVITSLKTVSGWRSIGNGIYESTSSIKTNTVQVVLINGEIHEMGRYPNRDIANEGYLNIDDVNGKYQLSSSELGGSPSWNGAEVVIKKNQWIIDTHQISSHSGGQVKFNGNISSYPVEKDFGFFIQNHIKTLDTYGEWYFNPSTKKINIYFGNSNPSSMKIEVSTLDNLLIKDYRDTNVTIENLQFRGVNSDAIRLEGGRNIKILDSEINFTGENAITALSVVDLLIERNSFNNTYNNGMYLRYGNNNAIIRNNEIRKTALIAGRTQNQDAAGVGIFAYGENVLVQNNTIINSGFNGIQFSGNYSVVKNNYVDTFCQIKGDGGGIYTFGGVKYQAYRGRKIEGNIVVNSIGSKGGIPKKGVNHKPLAEGIFLDDHSNNIEITGNTVGNTENSGLKMSNVYNINVANNTFFNSHSSITLGNNVIGEDTRKVNIENNQFFAKTSDQNSYSVKTYKDDIISMANFDKNYFFRPFGDEFSILSQYSKNGKTEEASDNLEEWNSKFDKDQNSVSNTIDISTYSINKKIGTSLYSNSTFDKNTRGISCSNCSQVWDGDNKLNGGAIKVKNSGNSTVKLNLGELKKDKTYLLKLNATANKAGNIQAYLRYSGSPWAKLSTMTTFEVSTDINSYEILVSPYVDAEEVSLMISTSETNFTYWMDDLEFVEVEATFINPEEEIVFEFNPTKNSKTISLSGTYVNAKLEKFSGEVTIPAYGSVVLVRVSKEVPVEKVEEIEKPTEVAESAYYHFGNEGPITYNGQVYEKLNSDFILSSGSNVSNNKEGSNETLFQSARFDNELLFKIPLENGIYTIKTHLNELYFGQNGRTQKAGQRVFDISLEGNVVRKDLDLYIESKNQETTLTFNKVEIKDGFLNLDLKASSNNALISAVSITPESIEIKKPEISISIKENISQVTEGDELTLISEITNLDGNIEKVDFYCGLKLVGSCEELPYQAVIEEIPAGENYVWATVTDKEGNVSTSSEIEFTAKTKVIEVVESKPVEVESNDDLSGIYYHFGNDDIVEYNGQDFLQLNSDYLLSSGSNVSNNEQGSENEIFQFGRFDNELLFKIPLENGIYTIQTYHNELYFGQNGRTQKAGQRVFDIAIEGEVVKENLDLYVENKNQETILTFSKIEITDGFLNLDLKASSNNSLISAISIVPVATEEAIQTPGSEHLYFLNTGSDSDATINGINYLAEGNTEKYYNDGTGRYNNTKADVEKLFQTERSGKNLKYTFPVPNGTYTIFTMHNEVWFGYAGGASKAGKRVYDISLQGEVLKSDFDLFVENNNAPTLLSFENIEVTDGKLVLELNATVNNASISGIAIIGSAAKGGNIAANLRTSQNSFNRGYKEMYSRGYKEMDMYTETVAKDEIRIFPNPAKERATLEINAEIGRGRVLIHNMNGQLVSHFDLASIKTENNQFNIPLNNLTQGMYLVSISNEQTVINKQRLIVNP